MIRHRLLLSDCCIALGLWLGAMEPCLAVDATDLKSPFTLDVSVVDRASGRAIVDATVLGREYATGPVLWSHSGPHVELECVRTAVGRTREDGKSQLAFPPLDPRTASAITGTNRRVGLLVYKAGYCIPALVRFDAPQFRYGPYEHQPSAPNHTRGQPVNYDPPRLELDRSSDTGEYRLQYLAKLVSESGCMFPRGGDIPANPEIAQAVVAEAEGTVRTDYDRFLLDRVRALAGQSSHLAGPNAVNPTETTITVVPASFLDELARGVSYCRFSQGVRITGRKGGAATISVLAIQPGGRQNLPPSAAPVLESMRPSTPHDPAVKSAKEQSDVGAVDLKRGPPPPAPVETPALLCRCGEPDAKCDINQRDASGQTLLMKALPRAVWVSSPKPRWPPAQIVKFLLDSGINPNIETNGITALDMILADVSWANAEAAGERMQQNIAVLEVLVSNGKVTIQREDREQLDQPESRWAIKDPTRVAYYRKLRDLTKALPLRQEFRPSCPMLTFALPQHGLQLVDPRTAVDQLTR